MIPTLNEASNLPHVFARIPTNVTEIIVVDGLSTDDTVKVAELLHPETRIVLQNRSGKGNALACGFAAARGDIIVMLDADGSTDPAEIPLFVTPLLHGADFVKGSRFMPDGGTADITRLRSLGARALCGAVNLLFGTTYTDLCYGYCAFWRECLPLLNIDCDGFEVETVLNVRAAKVGLSVVEVASYEHERLSGHSNLRAWRDGRRVIKAVLRERLTRPSAPCDGWRPEFDELVRDSLVTDGSSSPEVAAVSARAGVLAPAHIS